MKLKLAVGQVTHLKPPAEEGLKGNQGRTGCSGEQERRPPTQTWQSSLGGGHRIPEGTWRWGWGPESRGKLHGLGDGD